MGIYHQLSKYDSPFGETLWRKFLKVFFLEIKLSLLILIVIFFFVATLIQFKDPLTNTDVINIIFSTIVVCPAFLLSLRLLANPVKNIPRWPSPISFLNHIFSVSYLARPKENIQDIKAIKERFVSIYFSIIATVLFTLIFLYAYLVIIYQENFFKNVENFFIPSISTLDPVIIVKLILVFLFVLFLTTAIGEWFLKKYEFLEIDYGII
jgi:hypothetical protein